MLQFGLTNMVNVKVRMFECLLLNQTKITERLRMKFGIEVAYALD